MWFRLALKFWRSSPITCSLTRRSRRCQAVECERACGRQADVEQARAPDKQIVCLYLFGDAIGAVFHHRSFPIIKHLEEEV